MDVIPNFFLRHRWFSFGWLLLNYYSFTCFLPYAESSFVFVHLSAWLPLSPQFFSWAGVEPDLLWEARRTLKGEQVAACVWRRLLGDSATTDSPPDGEVWLTVMGTLCFSEQICLERAMACLAPVQQEGGAVLLSRIVRGGKTQ